MTDPFFSRELLFAAACCRWPLSEQAIAAIREAHNKTIDWPNFLQVVNRQRVVGLARNALLAARIDVPSPIAQMLALRAQRIARQNVVMGAETFRLQCAFDAANIPVIVLKGVALGQLAYDFLKLKHARDIDLLVPADRAEMALHLLERNDYALAGPAEQLSEAQRRAVIRYGKEVELVHRGSKLRVELQWRLAINPLLLDGVDAYSPTQTVFLSEGGSIRTLAEDDLFAYLCVHGAYHAWSRLKWLADLNALVAVKHNANILRLYRHAQARGAGLCAGQGLLLCHQLLGLTLPASLEDELRGNKRLEKLVAIALSAIANPTAATNRGLAGLTRGVFAQFLLGQGWAYIAAQCRIASVGIADVIRFPLPPSLHFLYPILRLPMWIWRRAIRKY